MLCNQNVASGSRQAKSAEANLRDLLKTCTTKALYICDLVHGIGEVAKAAITSKVSVEATGAGVRFCGVWAHHPWWIFADIGRAVGRSELTFIIYKGSSKSQDIHRCQIQEQAGQESQVAEGIDWRTSEDLVNGQ